MTPHTRPGFDKLDPQDNLAEPAAIRWAGASLVPPDFEIGESPHLRLDLFVVGDSDILPCRR